MQQPRSERPVTSSPASTEPRTSVSSTTGASIKPTCERNCNSASEHPSEGVARPEGCEAARDCRAVRPPNTAKWHDQNRSRSGRSAPVRQAPRRGAATLRSSRPNDSGPGISRRRQRSLPPKVPLAGRAVTHEPRARSRTRSARGSVFRLRGRRWFQGQAIQQSQPITAKAASNTRSGPNNKRADEPVGRWCWVTTSASSAASHMRS